MATQHARLFSFCKSLEKDGIFHLLTISALGISEALTLFFFPSLEALFFPPLPTTSHFPLDAILDLGNSLHWNHGKTLPRDSMYKSRISRQNFLPVVNCMVAFMTTFLGLLTFKTCFHPHKIQYRNDKGHHQQCSGHIKRDGHLPFVYPLRYTEDI